MRCYICNYCDTVEEEPDLLYNSRKRSVRLSTDNKPICTQCRDSIKDSHRKPAWMTGPLGEASNISAMLDELEKRIPGLFVGPACPLDFAHTGCDCTYETCCRLLKDKDNKSN